MNLLTLEDIAERYKGTMRAEVVRTLAQMNSCLPHMRFVQSDLPEYYEYSYQRCQATAGLITFGLYLGGRTPGRRVPR